MNAELMKLRKKRQLEEQMDSTPVQLNQDVLMDKIYLLNTNMTDLYNINKSKDATIDVYIQKITANIYLILDMFNDMGIYPDYFYNIIVKINMEYRNLVSDGEIRGNYGLYNLVNFSSKISRMIKEGLNSEKYQIDLSNSKDISECFLEMISFFQKYNLAYNVNTLENCQKTFKSIYYNVNNIINNTLNNDYIFEDIECLTRLLFEYISFFAAIGVNPKKYLDEYIENQDIIRKSK